MLHNVHACMGVFLVAKGNSLSFKPLRLQSQPIITLNHNQWEGTLQSVIEVEAAMGVDHSTSERHNSPSLWDNACTGLHQAASGV